MRHALGRSSTMYENGQSRLSKATRLILNSKLKMEILKEKKVARVIKEAVLKGEQLKMAVTTDSMRPFLRPGDKVVAKKCTPAHLACGDIILYMLDYVSYVHRFILKKEKDNRLFLITKADKATYFNTPTPSSELIGKVIAVEKDGFYINLDGILWKAINRFLGLSSFLEAVIFNFLRFVKRKILNRKPA